MTRFIQNDDLAAPAAKTIELQIFEIDGGFAWSYSSKRAITVSFAMPIEIKLKNHTDAKASIFNYASSGMYASTVTPALHSPISSFALDKDGQSVTFTISLFPNQLIDFGVFVLIEQSGRPDVILFCDPQASNDPIKTPP